jgi:methionine salvage enolase-phosphatase E1
MTRKRISSSLLLSVICFLIYFILFCSGHYRNKREAKSYYEITQSVGVDKSSEVLFITDVYSEAVAAKSAGIYAILSF